MTPVNADADAYSHSSADASWRGSVLSSCAFALAVVLNPFAATMLAGVGIALLWLSLSPGARTMTLVTDLRLTAAVVAVALVAIVVPQPMIGSPSMMAIAALPVVAIALAVTELIARWTQQRMFAAGLIVCGVALVTGGSILRATNGADLDVVFLHRQAAAALAHGQSPYSDAVMVPNGAPGVAPGSMIVGYPYPPIVAFAYASSTWIAGDPRWLNLGCWIVMLCAVLATTGLRRERSAFPVMLVTALPGWGLMLQSGWTEGLSAALLAVAAATWHQPVLSGLALGAALGSKQYFVVILPLILLYRGAQWRRRAITALLAAVATIVPAAASGLEDSWRSLVWFHTQTPLRADSSNLAGALVRLGLPWAPPTWLALGSSLALSVLLVRRVPTAAGFWRVMGLGLAVFFVLSRQAMPNYWYLVAIVAILGASAATESDPLERGSATLQRPGQPGNE